MATSKEASRGSEERRFQLHSLLSVSVEALRVCGGPVNFVRLGLKQSYDETRGGMEEHTFIIQGDVACVMIGGSLYCL